MFQDVDLGGGVIPLGAAGLSALALAIVVAQAPAGRRGVQTLLASVLTLEGLSLVVLAGHTLVAPFGTGDRATSLAHAPALDAAGSFVRSTLVAAVSVTYLLLLGHLDTPIARWLRTAWGKAIAVAIGLVALVPVLVSSAVDVQGGPPADTGNVYALYAVVGLFALIASLWAFFTAPRGTAARRQAGGFAAAFGLRDLATIASVVLYSVAMDGSPSAFVYYPWLVAVGTLAFLGTLGYVILRARLFDIDLKVKASIPKATIATAFVLVFLVGNKLAEAYLSHEYGWALGTLPAAILIFATPRLNRMGERIARALMPSVHETDEYVRARKLEVYAAALEEATDGSPAEREFLGDLRLRLGITSEEHRTLALVAARARRPSRPTLGRRFRIERELGHGTTGHALLAHDLKLDRAVVLKQPLPALVVDPAARGLFLREARLAARVHDPHVVEIFDVLSDEDPPVLVMEYVEGGTLEDALVARGALPADEGVELARGVLSGLSAIHAAGVVHRDLKPANVLLARDATPKLADFGVASDLVGTGTLSSGAVPIGTLTTMSPEAARGEHVTPASDIYSVGAMLYRMLTGEHAIDLQGASEFEARRRISESPPRLPHPRVPQALEAVLRRALEKDPRARFADARDMARALPPTPSHRVPVDEVIERDTRAT